MTPARFHPWMEDARPFAETHVAGTSPSRTGHLGPCSAVSAPRTSKEKKTLTTVALQVAAVMRRKDRADDRNAVGRQTDPDGPLPNLRNKPVNHCGLVFP